MATANAMYDRIEDAYRLLFSDGSQPSLILAHSRRTLRLALDKATEGHERDDARRKQRPKGDDDAASQCAAWLADHRKKALLAEVGIGTIDPALVAVLEARHQSLRLWGFAGKVLVVDEVHAADAAHPCGRPLTRRSPRTRG